MGRGGNVLKKKYYLQIEIRYSVSEELDEDVYERNYFTKFIHSPLFDNEEACIEHGNEVVSQNRWIEQYPGYKDLKLKRIYGLPLLAPRLKNGAQIFISVQTLNISISLNDINEELQKFNLKIIDKKIE